MRLPAPLGLLVAGLAATFAGCDITYLEAPPLPPPASEAASQLALLTVAPHHSMRGYSRERFPHWSAQDGECDTREVGCG